MKIRRIKYYSASERTNEGWMSTVINSPSNKSSINNSVTLKLAEAEKKGVVQASEQRSKAINQMTENSARIRAAQIRKQLSDQRIAQNNRRLEVRKDEAAARIAVQIKKTEATTARAKSHAFEQYKIPTKVNTPISNNNQTRINK